MVRSLENGTMGRPLSDRIGKVEVGKISSADHSIQPKVVTREQCADAEKFGLPKSFLSVQLEIIGGWKPPLR